MPRTKRKPASKQARYAYVKRTYGLEPEQYDALVAFSGGRCFICDCKPKRLLVEHCHDTGRVRGLACTRCNNTLGMLRDDAQRARWCADYLSSPPAFWILDELYPLATPTAVD